MWSPGPADRGDQRVRRRPCRGANARAEAALELAERVLERAARRVRRARVVVVPDELAGRGLDVGRGLVDRRDDRRRSAGRAQAGVDGARGEARVSDLADQRLQQVGAGDDARRAAVVGDEQRLALAGEQLDGLAHRVGRWPRRGTAAPSRRRSARSAPRGRRRRGAAARARRSSRRPSRVLAGDDRQLADAVLVQQRDRVAHALVGVDGDERRDLPARRACASSTSATVRPPGASRKPYWRIQLSL